MRMALETVTHRTFLPILPSFPIPTSRSSVPSPEPRARPRVPFESPQGPCRRAPPHPRVPAPATKDGARGGPSRPGLAARPSQDGGLAARPGDTAWGGARQVPGPAGADGRRVGAAPSPRAQGTDALRFSVSVRPG